MNTFDTYGKVLRKIMERHDISISALYRKLNLSSRNQVNRILNSLSRHLTVQKFNQTLHEKQKFLPFTEDDLMMLDKALESEHENHKKIILNANIRALFDCSADEISYDFTVCTSAYGINKGVYTGLSLTSIFNTLVKYKTVKIFAVNCTMPFIKKLFMKFEKMMGGVNVSVEHFIRYDGTENIDLTNLIRFMPLINNDSYTLYRGDKSTEMTSENYIIIYKESIDNMYVDRINIVSEDSVIGIFDVTDNAVIDFYLHYFDIIKQRCSITGKQNAACGEKCPPVLAISERLAKEENQWLNILIKPDICVNQISPDILYSLISDSGFFGLGCDSPIIARLYPIYCQRFASFNSVNKSRVHLFTRTGLEKFADTGRLSDHIQGLRAFHRNEISEILGHIIKNAELMSGFRLHMFREDFDYTGLYCEICGTNSVNFGMAYEGNSFGIRTIYDKNAASCIGDYIIRNLIPEAAYSHNETVEYMKKIYRQI